MYFEDEPLNDQDQLLLNTPQPELLIAAYQPAGAAGAGPDELVANWDIMLPEY